MKLTSYRFCLTSARNAPRSSGVTLRSIPTSRRLACTDSAMALSRGRPMMGKSTTSFWPPFSRMPSPPAFQPASSRICLALAGSKL